MFDHPPTHPHMTPPLKCSIPHSYLIRARSTAHSKIFLYKSFFKGLYYTLSHTYNAYTFFSIFSIVKYDLPFFFLKVTVYCTEPLRGHRWKKRMLFRSLEIISFERNMLFRSLEIISFERNMLFRSLEIISFERNMLFRSLEISFAILDPLGLGRNYFVPSKSFRLNEICYFVPSKCHSPS